ncbi:CPBP family intramembrane metalloprotease [Halorubellus sp. JP-L1]|uniref:CPBP family intramembrane glutamic endopeptidase n=1 Tax=Halorubellus sp. JP-L1 TaxID=2715753 RepID=UPI00140DD098|nr:type II CAAX endopeptidase family protein [Halorubellus sp. JP-L1]NHN41553.1 CPBP family intramembrane metalloprotease [Halorubellus sp. JP-L1]
MSLESRDAWNPGRFVAAALGMALVGATGILALVLWQSVVYSLVTATIWEPPLSGARSQIVSTISLGLGMAMTGAGYVVYTNRSWAFIDVQWPSLRDLAWIAVGLVGLFALLQVVSILLDVLGISAAQHTTTEAAKTEPSLLLPLIPLSILVVGPAEELVYRNVVQKGLYEHAPRVVAVLTASVIFSLVHIPAYAAGASTSALVATLAIIFTLSLVLGTVYERTENLVVPAVVHGGYNAVLFGLDYLDQTASVALALL